MHISYRFIQPNDQEISIQCSQWKVEKLVSGWLLEIAAPVALNLLFQTDSIVHVNAKLNPHRGDDPIMVSYPGTVGSLNKYGWEYNIIGQPSLIYVPMTCFKVSASQMSGLGCPDIGSCACWSPQYFIVFNCMIQRYTVTI